jgi:hypothetical protein
MKIRSLELAHDPALAVDHLQSTVGVDRAAVSSKANGVAADAKSTGATKPFGIAGVCA